MFHLNRPKGTMNGQYDLLILRFDPEETAPSNAFSHVQTCDREDFYQTLCGFGPERISGELPRIPLIGREHDAQSLLLALMVSLYGLRSKPYGIVAEKGKMTQRTIRVHEALCG